MSLIVQKKALRKSIATVLKTLSVASIDEQSNLVTEKVLAIPGFQKARRISCYLSMPSGELDTSRIASEILKSGKELYVPKIDKTIPNRMDFVRVYSNEDLDSCPAGLWGIKEPPEQFSEQTRENALEQGLDMILVPGVAFDRTLSRLGHGKGYYDRYISSYVATGRPRPLLVALSLREQLVGDSQPVPIDDTDWKMDMIVLPDESIAA